MFETRFVCLVFGRMQIFGSVELAAMRRTTDPLLVATSHSYAVRSYCQRLDISFAAQSETSPRSLVKYLFVVMFFFSSFFFRGSFPVRRIDAVSQCYTWRPCSAHGYAMCVFVSYISTLIPLSCFCLRAHACALSIIKSGAECRLCWCW